CGYHFVIGNGTGSGDGELEVGPRWLQQATGAHTRLYGAESSPEGNYYNEYGIGIVLVGNFNEGGPSARQVASLARLVQFLMERCEISTDQIYGHGRLKSTDCPGRYFSMGRLHSELRSVQ